MQVEIEDIISKIKIRYEEKNALYTGKSGLFLFELLANRMNENSSDIASQILVSKYDIPTLCNGKAGVNWLFTYLFKDYGIIEKDIIDQIRLDDHYLKQISIDYLNIGNYDFMHGALGISYYLLYDKDNIDIAYHKKILKLLDEQYENQGAFYYKSHFDTNPEIKKISLGLSHGLPSILRYIAECYKHGIDIELSKKLSYILINEIKGFQNNITARGYFQTIVNIGEEKQDGYSRLAWCYGDPGVAIVLYHVGKIFKDKDLENYGKQILLDSTIRLNQNDAMIFDAGICHGCAGLIQIYNRMWIETEDVRFKKAAEHWVRSALSLGTYDADGWEFKKYNNSGKRWDTAHSLLEGNAGVGLALNSYLTGDVHWDYCLMLND